MGDVTKNWYSVELDAMRSNIFKHYLHSLDIYFEPSEAGQMVYFKCHMTEEECETVNSFLELLSKGFDNDEQSTA